MAVIGVNVIRAPATIPLELDVAKLPMHGARATAQAAHPQQQRLMDRDQTTSASCTMLAASGSPVKKPLPLKDGMVRT